MFFTSQRPLLIAQNEPISRRILHASRDVRRGSREEGIGNIIGNLFRIQSFSEMREVYLAGQPEVQQGGEGEESDNEILPNVFRDNRDDFNFFE